jgi:hypothetical protein
VIGSDADRYLDRLSCVEYHGQSSLTIRVRISVIGMRIRSTVVPIALLALAGGAAAGVGTSGVGAASMNPKTMVLRSSDLPVGFKQVKAQSMSNAKMAKSGAFKAAQLTSHGRTSGYAVYFSHGNGDQATRVSDMVSLFTGATGAQWFYQQAHQLAVKALPTGSHQVTSIAKLGQASLHTTATTMHKGESAVQEQILFREGTTVVVLRSVGPKGGLPAGKLVSMAQSLDHRILGH